MKQYGAPYKITSRVTDFAEGQVVEWQHPLGHRWRWEFTPLPGGATRVTETFDYRTAGALKNKLKYYTLIGARKSNASGIEATLAKLRDRYAR